MKRIFAFLYEPASYTVNRNINVYKLMKIDYCYLHGDSLAKSSAIVEDRIVNLEKMSLWHQFCFIRSILKKYDKIIFNGYADLRFLILFILNIGYRKSIGIDSDTQYREPVCFMTRWIKRLYLNIIFRNKYVYGLAGGNYTHKDLFRKYGMKEERILLMPMVVNNLNFDNPEFRSKKSMPFHFLYVGRLIKCKNLEFMILGFLKYRTKHPNSELHLVGKGDLEDSLKYKFGQCKGVFFDGPKYDNELLNVYRNSHVLILPSIYEPWGLVVNEAMSAGLPVLVSEEVGARYDLVNGRETGFIFKSDDEQSFIQAMNNISNPATYKQYSENAHELMHKCWNYNLYRKCLEDFISL